MWFCFYFFFKLGKKSVYFNHNKKHADKTLEDSNLSTHKIYLISSPYKSFHKYTTDTELNGIWRSQLI